MIAAAEQLRRHMGAILNFFVHIDLDPASQPDFVDQQFKIWVKQYLENIHIFKNLCSMTNPELPNVNFYTSIFPGNS